MARSKTWWDANGQTPTPYEDAELREFARRMKLTKLRWHHSPNEGKRRVGKGIPKIGAKGVSVGFLDIMIFEETNGGAHGLAMELKRQRPDNEKPSDAQLGWLDHLKGRGWETAVPCGADEAWALVLEHYRL
jgi:hypothetical protein